jgi:hypothetical protein
MRAARGGQFDAPGRAIEHAHLEVGLEIADQQRQGRLGDPQLPGGRGVVPEFGHDQEGLDLPERYIHSVMLSKYAAKANCVIGAKAPLSEKSMPIGSGSIGFGRTGPRQPQRTTGTIGRVRVKFARTRANATMRQLGRRADD